MYRRDRLAAPRRWWLVIGVGALMMLVLTILGSGLAGAPAAAQDDPPSEATPEVTQTVEAEPTSDPFPVTDTMTETVLAVLDVYNQEVARSQSTAIGPVAIDAGLTRLNMPLVLAVRPTATPEPTATTQAPSPTATTPPPTPTRRPLGDPADMANTIWPDPSIRVVPGMTLKYEIRAKNYGKGAASVDRVTLPFDRNQLTVETASFSHAGDWVSERTADRITVSFNKVRPGESRKATIVFRVNRNLVDGNVINMRATTSWSDERGGGSWRSNWAPILAGKTNDSAPWAWLTVEPLGGYPGTTHRFFSDRFIPGEGVVTWLNTPSGVRALDLKGVADSFGRVTLDYRSTGLSAGTYSLVVYGARSNLTAIATFYVWQR